MPAAPSLRLMGCFIDDRSINLPSYRDTVPARIKLGTEKHETESEGWRLCDALAADNHGPSLLSAWHQRGGSATLQQANPSVMHSTSNERWVHVDAVQQSSQARFSSPSVPIPTIYIPLSIYLTLPALSLYLGILTPIGNWWRRWNPASIYAYGVVTCYWRNLRIMDENGWTRYTLYPTGYDPGVHNAIHFTFLNLKSEMIEWFK